MHPRIILATLNAKFIHASLGLRCLLANMQRYGGEDLYQHTVLQEFTIQRSPEDIVDALLAQCSPVPSAAVQIIGFGVYIWNVQQTGQVIALLKAQRPDVKIVLGGPEVSHELEDQPLVATADFVITGWGDVSFPQLCRALVHGPKPLMKIIAGVQPPLDELAFPYAHYSDNDLAQRVLYVEASRGCPFKCEFCLSALDKTAWAFNLDVFISELDALYLRGARTFKFVDRTFNLKIDASVRILEFFLERLASKPLEPLFVHFELVPDQLPERLKECITQFPEGVLQFEVGIQSLNPEVQLAISRKQDNAKTQANVQWLTQKTHAHLHADLIFGLPGESWESFAKGFDTLWSWGPHEIQLGVLKRLRGTPLAIKSRPQMVFHTEPPYAVLHTDALTKAEVQAFTRLARYWDLVANSGRFGRGLKLLLQAPSAFAAFSGFAIYLWQQCGATSGLTPEVLVDHLFDFLVQERGMQDSLVREALLADYLASGARAMPNCLKGYLYRPDAPLGKIGANHSKRQQRHVSEPLS